MRRLGCQMVFKSKFQRELNDLSTVISLKAKHFNVQPLNYP